LDWLYEKIGDAWRGTATTDPAGRKGGRVPAINLSAIAASVASYAEGKLYLAMPTGSNTAPNSVFVVDFAHKATWVYTYAFNVTAMFWDYAMGRMVVGDDQGGIHLMESGTQDVGTTIGWSVQTKAWTTQQDLLLEGMKAEVAAPNGQIVATAVLDGTSTITVGTYTNSNRAWVPLPLGGTIASSLDFRFNGTQSGTGEQGLYGLTWDFLPQPSRVTYWKTAPDNGGIDGEKIWDVSFTEIEIFGTGTVTEVNFVDNLPVSTAHHVGPTTSGTGPFPWPYASTSGVLGGTGPVLVPTSYPVETFGNIGYSTFTTTDPGTVFKIYQTFDKVRPEPPRVTSWATKAMPTSSEVTIKTWTSEVNPMGGNVLAQLKVDGVVVSTATFTGTLKKVFEVGLPNVTTGKTLQAFYSSSNVFKVYESLEKYPQVELEPKPYTKTTWLVTYKKAGGVTQMDMARFYAMDLEGPIGATATCTWLADSVPVVTNTLTLTQSRQYFDVISFPPGVRGYLFQEQVTSSAPIKVWRSNLDVERIGVKGFSRVTYNGTPQ
jgi:hypothetical protein